MEKLNKIIDEEPINSKIYEIVKDGQDYLNYFFLTY